MSDRPLKKPRRLWRRLALGFALLLAVLAGVAYTPAVQTWAVRRALAGLPGTNIEVGRIAIGLHSVQIENLRLSRPGLALEVPSAAIDLTLAAALRLELSVLLGSHTDARIASLTAKGWTLTLTSPSTPGDDPAAGPAASVFDGIFHTLQLPVDCALDHAALEGDVIRPEGRAHAVFTGGGLEAGHDATFALNAGLSATGATAAPVSALAVRGTLTLHMDTPRTFSRVAFIADTTAAGPKLASQVAAHLAVEAVRDPVAENYTLALTLADKELVRLAVGLPAAAGASLTGTWALDLSDPELAPFTLGHALPVFEEKGKGTFAVSRDFRETTAVGRLTGSAEKLELIRPELAAWGRTRLAADFDLVQQGDVTRVTKLSIQLENGSARPLASIKAAQGFEFNFATGELKVPDPQSDLLDADFTLPLAWAQPWLQSGQIREGTIQAKFHASARAGGFYVAFSNLELDGTILNHATKIAWQGTVRADPPPDATPVVASVNYSPQGWQVALPNLVAQPRGYLPGDAPAGLKDLRAGQLAGQGEPIKIEGTVFFPLAQLKKFSPVAWTAFPLSGGSANGRFTAELGAKQQSALTLNLTELTGPDQSRLADASVEARADRAADGSITFNVPIGLTQEGRKSAVTVGGTLGPEQAGVRALDAQLAGETVYLEDVTPLFELLSGTPAGSSGLPAPAAAPWAGVAGPVKFAVKQVVLSPEWQGSVEGTAKIDQTSVMVDSRGRLGADAPFTVIGGLAFTPGAVEPFALKADVTMTNFDPSRLQQTLEGRVNIASQLTGTGVSVVALAGKIQGKMQITSKGGVCRLLAVNQGNESLLQTAASTGASVIGTVVGVVAGDSAGGKAADSVNQIAGLLREIRYDQLNLTLTRDVNQDLVLEDFNLIAPEVRLSGSGRVRHIGGETVLEQPLTLQLQVAARGALGSIMSTVGLVSTTPDDLGYLPLSLELPVLSGSLGAPDTGKFYTVLAERAGKKASDTLTNGLKKGAGSLLNGLNGLLK